MIGSLDDLEYSQIYINIEYFLSQETKETVPFGTWKQFP